jgi:hypothetical protein
MFCVSAPELHRRHVNCQNRSELLNARCSAMSAPVGHVRTTLTTFLQCKHAAAHTLEKTSPTPKDDSKFFSAPYPSVSSQCSPQNLLHRGSRRRFIVPCITPTSSTIMKIRAMFVTIPTVVIHYCVSL